VRVCVDVGALFLGLSHASLWLLWYAMSVTEGLENVVTCMMSEGRLIEVVPNYIVNFTSLQTCMSVMRVRHCGVCLSVVCVNVMCGVCMSVMRVCQCRVCISVAEFCGNSLIMHTLTHHAPSI